MTMRVLAASAALLTVFVLGSPQARAQYKNGQFGFEGGYYLLGKSSELTMHNFTVGLRGGYKVSDRWWFTGRAHIGFIGERTASGNTVVLFHLVPLDARYYFKTDALRPFIGVTNSFQFLFHQTIENTVRWGPGVTAGLEIRLHRDIYLGFETDLYWMLAFEHSGAPLFTLTTQLLFFL